MNRRMSTGSVGVRIGSLNNPNSQNQSNKYASRKAIDGRIKPITPPPNRPTMTKHKSFSSLPLGDTPEAGLKQAGAKKSRRPPRAFSLDKDQQENEKKYLLSRAKAMRRTTGPEPESLLRSLPKSSLNVNLDAMVSDGGGENV